MTPRIPVAVVAFSDEEGARFGVAVHRIAAVHRCRATPERALVCATRRHHAWPRR